jgi:hypothetical protein
MTILLLNSAKHKLKGGVCFFLVVQTSKVWTCFVGETKWCQRMTTNSEIGPWLMFAELFGVHECFVKCIFNTRNTFVPVSTIETHLKIFKKKFFFHLNYYDHIHIIFEKYYNKVNFKCLFSKQSEFFKSLKQHFLLKYFH